MAQVAIGMENMLATQHPGMSHTDRLTTLTKRLHSQFPEYFGTDQAPRQEQRQVRRTSGGVESSVSTASAVKQDPFAALPTEAKSSFKMFVDQGIYKNDAKGRSEFVALYHQPNVDS